MIYFDGLESVGECLYLSETLDNRSGNCNIYINPDSTSYIVGKVVIINRLGYSVDKIRQLISQNCKVISRIPLSEKVEGLEIAPYILRINPSVMWNGRDIERVPKGGFQEMMEEGLCNFSVDDYVLYFPRIYQGEFSDSAGNLTILGWLCQQVGVNIVKNTPFINLDLIKTKKILL